MAKNAEPVLKVNGKSYNVADLSENARKQMASVQAADAEIRRLQVQLAITQTAKNVYQRALLESLPKE